MPLYDYECRECGLLFEAHLPIARRNSSCPDCVAPCAPLITFRGAFQGLSTPGHATQAWAAGGMYGAVRSGESAALAQTRGMLEAGAYSAASCRTRQSALTFSRAYEMARKAGMEGEARAIEGRMHRLAEVRGAELRGEPERVGKGGRVRRLVRNETTRDRKGVHVTRHVRYET